MEVAVLGPVRAELDGGEVDLGTPKQRALVAALALSAGRPVPVDTIVDLLWGDAPPAGVAGTLQAYVSGLRRVLEPNRERRAPATVLVTASPGYALRLERDALDTERFEHVLDEQHRRVQLLSGVGPPVLSGDELARSLARHAVRRARPSLRCRGRAQPAGGAPDGGPRGPCRRPARARSPQHGGSGPRSADRGVPAPGAVVEPARPGADSVRPPGRRTPGAA